MKKLLTPLLLVFVFSLGLAPVFVSATSGDVTPPDLITLDFTPKTVDVAQSSAYVYVTATAQDDLSGINNAYIDFKSPSGIHRDAGLQVQSVDVNGVATLTGYISLPQFSESGTYTLYQFYVIDLADQFHVYDAATFQALGLPTEIVVTNNIQDITPPDLITFDYNPKTIDVSQSLGIVTVTATALDDISGIRHIDVIFRSSAGLQFEVRLEVQSVGGNGVAILSGNMAVPQFFASGVYTLYQVVLSDFADNYYSYDAAAFQALGLPTEIVVTNNIQDITPPDLITLDFTPKTVDVAQSSAYVYVTATAQDDLSGINNAYIDFKSPSGIHRDAALYVQSVDSNGVATLKGTISFPQFLESGTYTLNLFYVIDLADQFSIYDAAAFQALGLPTEIVVTNNIHPIITTTSLPDATFGVVFLQSLEATSGLTPYSWSLISGSGNLPPGFNPISSDGTISGMPTSVGTYNFTVQVEDQNYQTDTQGLSITVHGNTSTGSNVQVTSGSTTLTFSNVTQEGQTNVTTSSTGTQPPTGFKLGNPPTYYSISTTSMFTGQVEVCLSWIQGQFNNENNLKLFHFNGTNWTNITESGYPDTVNNVICGLTTSFSDFAIFEKKQVEATIDIKPGSYPNSINLGSNGTVAVAIFSTTTFDARTIDPLTVTLASAPVQLRGNGTSMSSIQDVNSDGLLDLTVHVSTEALQFSETDQVADLIGYTFDNTEVIGSDTVRVVQ